MEFDEDVFWRGEPLEAIKSDEDVAISVLASGRGKRRKGRRGYAVRGSGRTGETATRLSVSRTVILARVSIADRDPARISRDPIRTEKSPPVNYIAKFSFAQPRHSPHPRRRIDKRG